MTPWCSGLASFSAAVFPYLVTLQVGTLWDFGKNWKWGQIRTRVNRSLFFSCLVASVCLDIMSGRGKKNKQFVNRDTEYHFKMFSDNTLDIIKLNIHYL